MIFFTLPWWLRLMCLFKVTGTSVRFASVCRLGFRTGSVSDVTVLATDTQMESARRHWRERESERE